MIKRTFRAFWTGITALIIIAGGIAIAWGMHLAADELPIKQYFSADRTNAIWDWSNPTNKDAQTLKEQADFLHFHQINVVYVDVGGFQNFIKPSTNAKARQDYEAGLQRYIAAMHKRNIKVFAAAGDSSWSDREKWVIPQGILANVYSYNQRHAEDSFSGVEFDIEAYNQPGFDTGSTTMKTLVLQDYLDLVDQLRNQSIQEYKKSGKILELGCAVPYWFDNENGNIPSVVHNGKKGPTLYHLMDSLNVLPKSNVVVMAYRNVAVGNDGIIAHARTEVDYATAKSPHVKVLIGQEVNDVEPAKITYYDSSVTELSNQIKIVEAEFKPSQGYGGVAINDLAGYMALNKLQQ